MLASKKHGVQVQILDAKCSSTSTSLLCVLVYSSVLLRRCLKLRLRSDVVVVACLQQGKLKMWSFCCTRDCRSLLPRGVKDLSWLLQRRKVYEDGGYWYSRKMKIEEWKQRSGERFQNLLVCFFLLQISVYLFLCENSQCKNCILLNLSLPSAIFCYPFFRFFCSNSVRICWVEESVSFVSFC